MSIDQRFRSTVPASLEALPEPVSVSAPIEAARRADFEVAGAAAAEFGLALAQVRAAVGALAKEAGLSREQMRPLESRLDQAHRAMMHGRLLAKVTAGDLDQSPIQINLAPLLEQALDGRARQPLAWGRIERSLAPVTVVIDRDIAAALIDALLDWTLGPGHRVHVSLQIKEWPPHALLQLRAQLPETADDEAPEHERLCWYLAQELCRATGATLDRVRSDGQVLVMVEFPRTVREIDGLSAMEVDLGAPSHPADGGRVLAGHRALIISSDVKLREEAKRICQEMGLQVDNVPSSSLAERHCAHSRPDLVIVDERFNDERFQQLRARLSAQNADFPLIEIIYSADASFALSGWGAGGMTRVGRAQLASHLPQALALEIAKVL